MILANEFLAGRVIPFPAVAMRVPPTFHAFPAGSRSWNATVVVVDAGSRLTDGELVIEILSDGALQALPIGLTKARAMLRGLTRAIEAAGPEAAQVVADGVMFAADEAEALATVLRRAVRRCEAERRGR